MTPAEIARWQATVRARIARAVPAALDAGRDALAQEARTADPGASVLLAARAIREAVATRLARDLKDPAP